MPDPLNVPLSVSRPLQRKASYEPIYFFIRYPAAAAEHHNLRDRAVGIEGPLDMVPK